MTVVYAIRNAAPHAVTTTIVGLNHWADVEFNATLMATVN